MEPMSDKHVAVLRKCHVLLCKDLDVNDPMDVLYQESMFSDDDIQHVKAEITEKEKRRKFLSILKTKRDKSYGMFVHYLWESVSQRHLSVHLQTELQKIIEEAEKDENGTVCHNQWVKYVFVFPYLYFRICI